MCTEERTVKKEGHAATGHPRDPEQVPRGKGSCRQGPCVPREGASAERTEHEEDLHGVLESERPAGSHLVLQVMQKVLREESWHRRRQRGGSGPFGKAYLGWAVGKGGRDDGGLMTRIMVCPGGGAGHQLPAAHRDVREGQRQQSVPAGTGERCRRPHLALEGRRPTAGATESAKTGTGKGRCARALSHNRHTSNVFTGVKHINSKLMTQKSMTTTSVIPSCRFFVKETCMMEG